MRNEDAIRKEIAAAKAEYLANPCHEKSIVVTDLQQELSKYLSHGASNCQNCGVAPHGMLRSPKHFHNGKPVAAVYEVGCLLCKLQSFGNTPEESVKEWNKL